MQRLLGISTKEAERRDGKALLTSVFYKDFKQFGVKLEHFHSVSARTLSLLHSRGVSTSYSRDIPAMNSMVERRVRNVKEGTLRM